VDDLVTIAIPVFNGKPYLAEALSCALGQTYPNIEILVCDDGSTDGSSELAESVLSRGSVPYRVICGERLGMVENWNRCCREAKGVFVKLLFHDDLLEPDCVEKLVSLMSDPEVVFAYSARRVFGEPDQLAGKTYRHVRKSIEQAFYPTQAVEGVRLLRRPSLFCGAINKIGEPSVALLRKSCFERLGGFDPWMGQLADIELFYRWMCFGKVACCAEPLCAFRIHSRQMTSVLRDEENSYFERFQTRLRGLPVHPWVRAQLACRFVGNSAARRYPPLLALWRRLRGRERW
jgi:glycosyltransferase involved in cell wall biosynthesis